jgi:hypothetical protein
VLVTRDRDSVANQVSDTVEAFSAALFGLFCAVLGWAMWPVMMLAMNAVAWVIHELVRSN